MASSKAVTTRNLYSIDDLVKVVKLQKIIWGMLDIEIAPISMLKLLAHNGAPIIGAELEGEMIGFSLGLPIRRGDEMIIWSDMTGVVPACQGRGIGFMLKQHQRNFAILNGYDEIRWTFDPLQRGNARFNLCYLGVTADTYHENFYGEMHDALNKGLPSDRLEVSWQVRDERVQQLAEGIKREDRPAPEGRFLLEKQGGDFILSEEALKSDETLFIEIPHNLSDIKLMFPNLTRKWSNGVRRAFQVAFKTGFAAVDFHTGESRAYYILKRKA